jgi:nucleoid-associated protein YgaU
LPSSTQVRLLSIALAVLLLGGITAAVVVDGDDSTGSRPGASSTATAPGPATSSPTTPTPTTPSPAATSTAVPSPEAPAPTPPPAPVPTPAPPAPAPTAAPTPVPVYTVRPGDTLSAIATWYRLNGYQGLYLANRPVIGGNPDLIRPGQVFQIVDPRVRALALALLTLVLR